MTAAVYLLGGASGVGKSTLAYPLARRLGVPLVEIDDIVEALLAVTTSDQQPELHFWRTHRDEVAGWPPERVVQQLVRVARALAPAVAAVVDNHLSTNTPVLIEGDYLLPELAATDGVRAAFLHEPDVAQLIRNYTMREPGTNQRSRAEVSARYSDHLAGECRRRGVPVVNARPWDGALDRLTRALGA